LSQEAKYLSAAEWCEARAVFWKEWLVLCCYSQKYGLNGGCGFSRQSQINPPPTYALSNAAYAAFKEALYCKSGLIAAEFQRRFRAVERRIDRLADIGQLFAVFKGRWLASLIESELLELLEGKTANKSSLASRMPTTALGLMDFSGNRATGYLEKIRAVILLGDKPIWLVSAAQ
jgi:hypothetical protein